jgi:hypothetical protein
MLWTGYTKQATELSGTAYPVGTVVKPAGDYKYYVSESGWRKIASDEAFVANKFSTDYVVNTTMAVPATTGTDITGAVAAYTDVAQLATSETSTPVTTGIGALTLSGADTPATAYVSKGAQNALFSKFSVKATGGDVTVSQILVTRSGLGYDADIDAVRLYADGVQIGTDQSINTNTHKVTFKNLNWKISSGETQTLMIKANVNASPSGTNVSFNIASGDLTSNATSALGLPLNGNAMQFSALTVGQLNVTANNSAGSQTLISGATDQELACWNFNTTSTEDFNVDSVKLTNIGSAADNEVSNFVLKYGSKTLGTAATMSNNIVFVDMTASPYVIQKSKTQKVCLYGDIAAGITVSKTLRFQVAEAKHVVARGADSGGEVLTTYSGGTAFVSQSDVTNTISQGSATLSQSAGYAPVNGTFVKGVESNKMAAYKLTAGSTEGVKLTKLILTLAGTNVANTDFTNWTLYKIVDGAEVEIPVTGSVSGLTITFEDTNDGLLDVAKSENESFVVRADVSTSAAGNESSAKVYVGTNGTTNTAAKIKGLDSGDYITNGVTLSGVATGNAQTFSINAYGTMAASKAATAPAANTYAPGKTDVLFNVINLYATGEDMNVTSMQVIAYENSGVTDAADSSDITNVRLEDESGNPLGSTVATVSSGAASFSFDYTVPKETNKTIKVYADIPAAASPAGGLLHVDFPGDYDADADSDADDTAAAMTTTGAKSSADITETGAVTAGSSMTVTGPTLVASMATTPIASNYVINSTDVVLGTLVLTAGTSEDVKVTSIRISAGVNTDDLDATSSANTAMTNFELIDAVTGTQYGITQNLTDGTPDYAVFSGITNLTVTKGTSKNLYVRADVKASTGTYEVGVKDASSHVTGTGTSSNTSATVTPNGSTVVSTAATLTTNGSLTFSKDASSPVAALVSVGASGTTAEKTMLVLKAVATDESADVTMIKFTLSGGAAADFAANGIKLYQTVGSGAEKLLGSANMISTTATFNFDAGTFIIEKGKTNLITVKALFNGTGNGVSANDAPLIKFADSTNANDDTYITAKGLGSGAAFSDNYLNSTAGLNVANALDGAAQTLRKTIPTITYNSIGTTVTSGVEQDVFSFKVKADSNESVSLKQLQFSGILTDNVGTNDTLTLGSFKFYRGTTNLTSLVDVRTATTTIESGTSLAEGTTTFYVYWTTEENIPAGSEYTYYLKATPTGYTTTADDDRIQIRITSDASALTAGYRYLVDQDATVSEYLAYISDTDGANDTNSAIIWSDNSVDAHNYSITDDADGTFDDDTTSSGDWFNGYLVDTTPTNYSTLTN